MRYKIENKRLIELVKKDNTQANDTERRTMFTFFANNNDLYSKVDDLYDFEEQAKARSHFVASI